MTAQFYKRATIEIDGMAEEVENMTITIPGTGQVVRPARGLRGASGWIRWRLIPMGPADIPKRYRARDKFPRGIRQNLCGAPPISWVRCEVEYSAAKAAESEE